MSLGRRLAIATDGFRGGDGASGPVLVFGELGLFLDAEQPLPVDTTVYDAVLDGDVMVSLEDEATVIEQAAELMMEVCGGD